MRVSTKRARLHNGSWFAVAAARCWLRWRLPREISRSPRSCLDDDDDAPRKGCFAPPLTPPVETIEAYPARHRCIIPENAGKLSPSALARKEGNQCFVEKAQLRRQRNRRRGDGGLGSGLDAE
jgi:hypothetical protein